ncbi:MAG: MotA/TolQ/ExbB proton channel family protein [Planctomycetia bacterium]|nr:MotA/TolQ/ExbB proton channel family protein [Planctomycetia bacterium]
MRKYRKVLGGLTVCTVLFWWGTVGGQEPVSSPEIPETAVSEIGLENAAAEDAASSEPAEKEKISLWELIQKGGILMYPIGFMSLLVVAVGLERWLALQTFWVVPDKLFRQLDAKIAQGADPRQLYLLCRQYPSSASNILQVLLWKAGRPMLEVQSALQTAKDDEAGRLFGKVRWLVLAASVTPLIGLLGTVIGMIQAFMETAAMSGVAGVNRAEQLSQGIYTALVTTCAGLVVAIPAAILAHWYEGRILRLFMRLDRKLANFLSYLETREGKVHISPAEYETFYAQSRKGKH